EARLSGPPDRHLLTRSDALRAVDATAGHRRSGPAGGPPEDRPGGADPASAAQSVDPPRAGDEPAQGDEQGARLALRHGARAGRRSAAFPGGQADQGQTTDGLGASGEMVVAKQASGQLSRSGAG